MITFIIPSLLSTPPNRQTSQVYACTFSAWRQICLMHSFNLAQPIANGEINSNAHSMFLSSLLTNSRNAWFSFQSRPLHTMPFAADCCLLPLPILNSDHIANVWWHTNGTLLSSLRPFIYISKYN